jgi:hypothetical protein
MVNEETLDVRLARHIRALRSDARVLRGAARDRYDRDHKNSHVVVPDGDPDWTRANELDERADDLMVLLGGNAAQGADGTLTPTRAIRTAQDPSFASRRRSRQDNALNLVALWLNDDRLHSDPGTLDDVFDAIRQTGRYVTPNPLACCSHDDDYQGDPADLIADAKATLFDRILARVVSATERASAETLLDDLLNLAEEGMTPDGKARIARNVLGIRQPDEEDSR